MYTDGIKIMLTDNDVTEAILWGEDNIDSPENVEECYLFGETKKYNEFGYIWTKFHQFARLGYLGEVRTEEKLNEIRGTQNLKITIVTYGYGEGFAEKYRLSLLQDNKKVPAEFTRRIRPYEATVLGRPLRPGEPTSKTTLEAVFHYSAIDIKAKTMIVLDKGEGIELPIPADFSRYK